MKHLYQLVALALTVTTAYSQSFENVRATAEGNKVIISYDLLASRPDDQFTINIYGSHDNYTSPLRVVSGDVGSNVRPGTGKRVEWNVENELKTFRGDITFELRGSPIIMKLNFRFPMTTVKKGKSTTIEWLGGVSTNQAKIYLFQGEKMVSTVTETPNNGRFEWKIPKDLKAGAGYYYKLTSGSESVNSTTFTIKKKTGLLIKLSPLILAGAAAAALSGGGGGDPGGGGTPGGTDLPTPPNPGG